MAPLSDFSGKRIETHGIIQQFVAAVRILLIGNAAPSAAVAVFPIKRRRFTVTGKGGFDSPDIADDTSNRNPIIGVTVLIFVIVANCFIHQHQIIGIGRIHDEFIGRIRVIPGIAEYRFLADCRFSVSWQ